MFEDMVSRMKRIKGYFSRETVEALLATIGAIATVVGTVQVFIPDVLNVFPKYTLALLVVIACVATYLIVRPKKELAFALRDGRFTLELVVGDLFEQSSIVITADQALNSNVDLVGPDSLMGQANSKISNFKKILEEKRDGVGELHAGSVVDLGEVTMNNGKSKRVFVVACGRPTVGGTETDWSDLSESYIGLWNYLRSKNISDVSVPVIGSGFSSARLSHPSLLQLLIYSYYSAFCDRPVVRKLRVVVDEEDYDWDSWQSANRVLTGLGVKIS